jgi:flagellar hook-length control protein FliK
MAQMANRAGESEMRIGMNTSAFGNVEVRTTVHAGDVGLTIGSEKGDLRSLLTNDMPAIANTLQQQNLRLSNVSFMQGFSSSSNGSSNNGAGAGNPQQQSFVPRSAYGGIAGDLSIEDSVEELPFNESALASSSLSILA